MLKTRLLAATALAAGLTIAPTFASAQATAPVASNPDTTAATSDDDTVVVTGSRIRRPETDGVLPGVQLNAAQIQARGFTNALEALNDIPLIGPGATPLTGNNGGQAASLGAAFVDILDLGTQRSLTLVNGRRFVSGNSASLFVEGNATGAQVDVNVIPSTLIERVDVLTVGGAAAYGADAIAGVVNIILKKNYQGLQVRALSGLTSRGDAAQYQFSTLYGTNFAGDRGNVVFSFEYTRSDGLQADARDFRLARTNSYTNPFNGSRRNSAFGSAIIDVNGLNNGAFLRTTDDLIPSSLFGVGFVNQSLSFGGTVFNTLATAPTPYVPLTSTVALQAVPGGPSTPTLVTSNYITFQNGLSPVGARVAATSAGGIATTFAPANVGFFATTGQIIQGTPGAAYISGNGLNGAAAAPAGVSFTTFAPTALPTGVTAAQVFAQFGIVPPTGATAAQQTTLAVNVLQNNRFTAREFFAANPNVNVNAFVGTFVPGVPRVANTDTTPVIVRTNANGGTALVPFNQVLPFVAVPLEFAPNGTLSTTTFASGTTPTSPLTVGQAQGSNAGFRRSIENVVLRTQQDRYVANLIGSYQITDNLTFFTENTYANVTNRSLRNSTSQNFQSNTAENAPLLLNVNNPFLTAQNRTVLGSVGIAATAANQGNFIVTRQNQDIFGDNPFVNRNETFRLLSGLRTSWDMFGQKWDAEISGTYGRGVTRTKTTQIKDIEYQLALDAVDQGLATGGVANGNIVCRSQLFPTQYLGRSPIGTAVNVVRQPGANGVPTESFFTPTITQAQIDSCRPLNPFGYNNMSQASKDYVRQDVSFKNVSTQTLFTGSISGSLFDLPAGPLGISIAGEYRRDELRFSSDLLNQLGRGRAAPSSNFGGYTKTYEGGVEARIPLTGPNFLPFLGNLVFNPAVRVTKQSGAADSYRNTSGTLINPKSSGDPQTIFSLAGTWQPIRDIQFRGNYTRSVRQPSTTELFLGGQPVFSTPTDYCSVANLGTTAPAVRRTNCRSAVISAGLATDAVSADTFLANYVPAGVGLSGTYAGNAQLSPEKGRSWTVGGAFTPRFIPGLSISADYIHLDLNQTIVPTTLAQGIMSCYDSPSFPDTSGQTGTNLCNSFSRDAFFQIANGYSLSFLNLGKIELRALNIAGRYPIDLGKVGKLNLSASAYHLINYISSASGNVELDGLESAGTFSRPKWELQGTARYEIGKFYVTGTWNHRAPTRIFANGVPADIELYPFNRYPALDLFDAAVGVDVNEQFRLQFNITNLTDQNFGGNLGYLFQDYIDQIGRRFQVAATAKF
jgi:outer membrane receptor protein involved in Fe transport